MLIIYSTEASFFQHNPWTHWCICPILANSTIVRKWKWLFMNGWECKSLISTLMELVPQLDRCTEGLGQYVEI